MGFAERAPLAARKGHANYIINIIIQLKGGGEDRFLILK